MNEHSCHLKGQFPVFQSGKRLLEIQVLCLSSAGYLSLYLLYYLLLFHILSLKICTMLCSTSKSLFLLLYCKYILEINAKDEKLPGALNQLYK